MGRHDYLEELFNPLGHEVEEEGDADSDSKSDLWTGWVKPGTC